MVRRGSEQSEEYRLEMLRRLKKKYSDPDPPEVLEAKKVITKHGEEKAKAGPQITRLGSPLPSPDLCPQCWFMNGHRVALRAVQHPQPEKFDRVRCGECGYEADTEA